MFGKIYLLICLYILATSTVQHLLVTNSSPSKLTQLLTYLHLVNITLYLHYCCRECMGWYGEAGL